MNQFKANFSPETGDSEESLALFQTETQATGQLSLESILSRHLAGHAAGTNAPPLDRAALQQFQSFYHNTTAEVRFVGTQMNQVDIQTGKGLESYLPTPLTRFRVIKQRLTADIAALETQLQQYESTLTETSEESRLQDPTLNSLVHAVKKRLWILRRHENRVDLALAQMTQQFGLLPQLSDQLETIGSQASQVGMALKSVFGPASKLQGLIQQVEALGHLIEEQLSHPQPNTSVLSDLYLRYERAIRELNRQTLVQQQKPSMWQALTAQIGKLLLK